MTASNVLSLFPESEAPVAPSATPATDPVQVVFEAWKVRHKHPRARLDAKREKLIRARLRDGYTTEDLLMAVAGLALSTHHMGQNDRHTVYDDIALVCRDAEHVDKFMALEERRLARVQQERANREQAERSLQAREQPATTPRREKAAMPTEVRGQLTQILGSRWRRPQTGGAE